MNKIEKASKCIVSDIERLQSAYYAKVKGKTAEYGVRLILDCTCRYGTMVTSEAEHQQGMRLCSHKIAVLNKLLKEESQ